MLNFIKRRSRIEELKNRLDKLESKLMLLNMRTRILKYTENSYVGLYSDELEDWVYPDVAIRMILNHLGLDITRRERPGYEFVDIRKQAEKGIGE